MKAWNLIRPLSPQTLLLVVLVIGSGCSGSSVPTQPAVPGSDILPGAERSGYGDLNNRYMWGMWEISVSANHLSAEAVPVRTASMHLNAVGFLEKFPCKTCLMISNLVPCPDKRLSADLTLVHPFPGNPKLTGFDVRGVFITGADYQFPVSGRWIAWGKDLPRLLLPDGYTQLFNPWEYDFTQPGPEILKYIPGKFSTGGLMESTLNGYVSYRKEAPRRMFESGGSETRTVWLGVPDGPFKFGYAVDCCWRKVAGQVIDPVTDFPSSANCLEAYRVDVRLGSNLEPVAGTTQPVEVRVFDHQGLDSVESVILEAPDLFAGTVELDYDEDVGIDTHMFKGTVENEFGAGAGEYPLLVRVVDTEPDPNLGQIDAWFLYRVEVGSRNGWVRTWGGEAYQMGVSDHASATAVDLEGNIYVTGQFRQTVDLDPGPGVEEHTATKGAAFLTKFNPDGDFVWTRVWDGMGIDSGGDVVLDGEGNIYVECGFDDLIDVDPGPAGDVHEGSSFLAKLDSDGNYLWGRSWIMGGYLAIDGSGNVFIAGTFYGQTDMDPGETEDLRWPHGVQDVFLIKMGPNGEYLWARTWGGKGGMFTDGDRASSVVTDNMGNVYVAGYVANTADFDPGSGVVEHEAGPFTSKFAPTGKFLGVVNLWGTWANLLTLDDDGNLYVAGQISYNTSVDLDPGPGEDIRTGPCAFVAMYTSEGDYCWGRTWGMGLADPTGITVASTGELYVIGQFYWNLVDFDPSGNTDYHASVGGEDVYLTKYLSNGEYQWTRTLAGVGTEEANEVAADDSGSAFVVGRFGPLTDFDPGPGWEYREAHGGGDAYVTKIPPDGNW